MELAPFGNLQQLIDKSALGESDFLWTCQNLQSL